MAVMEEMKTKKHIQHTENNNGRPPSLSVTSLHVNVLNSLIKRQRLADSLTKKT